MRTQLLVLALGAVLFGCKGGDDPIDDTGDVIDDTGDTEDTEDTGPVASYCGDGVVDDGEQCDEGAANSADGDCSTDCTWNGWVTCDMLTGPILTLDTTTPQPDGTYHINGRFEGKVLLGTACDGDPNYNVVVQFTLPEAGSYLVSTANPGTTSATDLSLRTDCDDRAELSCNVANADTAGAAQAWIMEGQAGDTYVALIELVDGEPRGWHLSVTPIEGMALVGDSCDTEYPCADGSICTGEEGTATCVTAAAPTLTSSSVAQVGYYDYRITVTGTDPNHDVVSLVIPSFTDNYGDIWGDDDSEAPIEVRDPGLTWDGDTFTFAYVESIALFDTGLGDIVDIDFQVVDRTGAASNAVTVVYPEFAENEMMSYIGDACDMCIECEGNNVGYPRYCDPNPHADPADAGTQIVGLVCTWDDLAGTGASCQDRNDNPAPVMDGGEMSWMGPDALLTLRGYDTSHDTGIYAHITAVYTDGSTAGLGKNYLSDITWDIGDFVATGSFDTSALDGEVDHLEVLVEDKGNPSATTADPMIIDWVDPIAPVEVGYNEACDLHGWETTCEEPWVCGPTLSGIPACGESDAPVLYTASGTYVGGFFASMTFAFEAEDPNADWGAFVVEEPTGKPWAFAHDSYDLAWSPSPFGMQSYSGEATLGFANWIYRVWVEDADGNASNTKVVMGIPTQAEGEECNTGICSFFGCSPPESYCDIEGGLTCSNREGDDGIVQVCETAEAPVLDSVEVRRLDSDSFQVDFTGSDPNGDASAVILVQDEDGVVTNPNVNIDYQTPVYGVTEFAARFTGTITNPFAETTLEIRLKDWGFLESNALSVTVPPILEAGEECSDDDLVDQCWEGSECIDGTCFAYEPAVATAELAFQNHGRDVVVTVTGFDDKTGSEIQLKKAYVTLGGVTFEKSLNKYNVTWDGNEFTFTVDAKGVGTGLLVGEQFVQVRVVDLGGFEDTGLFFLTPQKGLGDDCDPDGIEDMCHAGLVCDTGTCVNDLEDPCAGIPLTIAEADLVPIDTSTGTKVEEYPYYATCGSESNKPNGKEVAIEYVATQDGTLVITTTDDPSDGYVHPGYLFARFDQCVNTDAVGECSNLSGNTNTVSVDVLSGDLLYIVVDSPSWPSGGPIDVTFSYE